MRLERNEAMKLMRICVFFLWLGGLVTIGCASQPPFPESSLTGTIVEVKITETLTPKEVVAKRGDELRWVNATGEPVHISFVDPLDNDHITCQKGFVAAGWGYLFRGIASRPEFLVVATVQGNDYASLCFSTAGTYAYTIRGKATETRKAGKMAGTVTIE
jgi:plastocyanin